MLPQAELFCIGTTTRFAMLQRRFYYLQGIGASVVHPYHHMEKPGKYRTQNKHRG